MEASNPLGIIPHVFLQQINNGELHVRISKEDEPLQGERWHRGLPDFFGQNQLSFSMKWKDRARILEEFLFEDMNIENQDFNKQVQISKETIERLKSLDSFKILFHCLNSGKDGGKYDALVNDLSAMERLEPEENLVNTPPTEPCKNQSVNEEVPQNTLVVPEVVYDVPEVVHDANAQIQEPFTAANREHSISESSSLGLHDDIQYTMHFLSMLDLAENNTPEVSSENSSDEENTDASLVYCPVHLQPAYI
jgi:hypothetical protein